MFGESLTVKYFNGSDYVETTADYALNGVIFPSSKNSNSYYSDLYDRVWLKYNMNLSGGNPNGNPDYITVDLSPIATIIDSSVFQCCIASNNGISGSLSSVYSSSRWYYKLDGVEKTQYSTSTVSSSYHDSIKCYISSQNYERYCTPVYINESGSSDFSLVTGRACFYGAVGGAIFISCPVVSAEAVVESGDTSGEHGGSDSGGGTDLTETNGLIGNVVGWLQSLVGFVQGIPEAIAGIFIPSDDALSDFSDNMSDLFDDHFGALSDARDIIDGYVDTFSFSNPQTYISIPTFSVPLGSDQEFSFGGYNVNVNPTTYNSNFSVLMDALKLIIDIVSTILVVNGLRNRFEGLLSGGDSGAD